MTVRLSLGFQGGSRTVDAVSVRPSNVADSVTVVFAVTGLTVTGNTPPMLPAWKLYDDGTVIAALFEASCTVYPPAGMLPVNRTSRETQFGSLQAGIVTEARPGSTVMVLAFDLVPSLAVTDALYWPSS